MKHFNIGSTLNRLFDNKKFLVVFSIVMAVVFWMVIDIAENPLRDVTVNDVTVKFTEQKDDNGNILSPIGEFTDKVSVTVNGPGYIVSRVSKDDISVAVSSYADVTKPGTYVLTLTATITQNGCTVSKISPSYVKVVYDYNTSSEIPVEINTSEFDKFVGADCEIYRSELKNNADGAEITALNVSGPSEIVGAISKVVIKPKIPTDADIQSITQNFVAQLQFLDNAGNSINAEQLTYNTDTYVRIIVYKTADVSLKPTFINLPEYYSSTNNGLPTYKLTVYNELSKKTQEVKIVKVRGPVDIIDRLIQSGLQLSPIDFSKVTPDSSSFNVSFILENGVEVVDGTEEVTVSLDLGTLRTKTLKIEPSKIRFTGLAANRTAASSYKKNITVVICGENQSVKNITADDIVLSVNCSGIALPTVETKVIVATVDGKEAVWVNLVEPKEISVIIE